METISEQVAAYRALGRQIKDLEQEKVVLRLEITQLVQEAGEPWSDNTGYAKFIKAGGPRITFPATQVNKLAQVWSESTDAIMAACGKSLLAVRKVSQPKTDKVFRIK